MEALARSPPAAVIKAALRPPERASPIDGRDVGEAARGDQRDVEGHVGGEERHVDAGGEAAFLGGEAT